MDDLIKFGKYKLKERVDLIKAAANASFSILMDPTTGTVTRTCTENARAGCDGTGGGAGTW